MSPDASAAVGPAPKTRRRLEGPEARRRTRVGLALSAAIIGAWAALHIYGVFFYPLAGPAALAAPLYVAVLCWLSVGLFIVTHDAIHGSLAPSLPALNGIIGRLAVTLYAGFSYEKLEAAHHRHHAAPGTGDDPDFSVKHPTKPGPWYWEFFTRYFGLRPLLFVHAVVGTYVLLLGANYLNVVVFYGVPAIASSFQLFYFGTYLPHRYEADAPFVDQHRTRTSGYSVLASLLSCYHFGYHHEHHLFPYEPWWRLPARRADVAPASA
ncbi:MAG: fatty acid desaturase [Pseudomonadota bacterium]